MVEIIDKHNRNVLIEGRNYGMAFAFLQQMNETLFHTVQPPSPCKDYLAEVVMTEDCGIPTKAYGLFYQKKLNIFNDLAFMAIKLLPTRDGSYSYGPSIEEDLKLLNNNYPNIVRLMNDFEEQLNIKEKTVVVPANDDYFLVKLSSEWCNSTHSISLYTLLLRILMVATKKDTNLVSFLESYSYHRGDKALLDMCMDKIKLIWETRKLPPNTIKYSKTHLEKFLQSPHDNGIVSWNSSFEEVPLGE